MVECPAVPCTHQGSAWTAAEFAAWRERCALTFVEAARATGYSRRSLLAYASGKQVIPLRAQLAMQQHEATAPAPSPEQWEERLCATGLPEDPHHI